MRQKVVWCFVAMCAAGCGGSAPPPAGKTAPAKVEHSKPETELATVTLSADAQKHLAIQTMKTAMAPVALTRTVGGEAIVPPGRSVAVFRRDRLRRSDAFAAAT